MESDLSVSEQVVMVSFLKNICEKEVGLWNQTVCFPQPVFLLVIWQKLGKLLNLSGYQIPQLFF